uniref:Uncharacterized protein n=2 Tax=Enterobacterales TaxID=91347 RepID=A0A7L8KA63_ECOLX|nr:hypothetical protein [Escherichia coli]
MRRGVPLSMVSPRLPRIYHQNQDFYMKATGKARIKGDKTGAKKCFLRGIFFNSMIEVVCVFK